MPKNKEGMAHNQSQKSRQEQDLHKRYWHGRLCPQCKEYTIDYHTAIVAYRILPGLENISKYGPLFIYRKPNWGIVCSERCRMDLFRRYQEPREHFKLVRYIEDWIDTNLPSEPGDGQRETILKQVGIDPVVNYKVRIYDTDDAMAGVKEFYLAD